MTNPGAPLVSLEAVSKAYATTVVLDRISLGVLAGERIGVVGRNGGGKTTLLRLLARLERPDSGRVATAGGLRVGYVDQRSEPPGDTVRDVVLAGYGAVHEWAGDAAVRTVLDGLGLPRIGLDAATRSWVYYLALLCSWAAHRTPRSQRRGPVAMTWRSTPRWHRC